MKYCVYTRCYYENQYLDFFIRHYLHLGFTHFIILNTGPPVTVASDIVEFTEIHNVPNEGNISLIKYEHLIKNGDFDWVLIVDNDELLLLDSCYKTIDSFVNDKVAKYENINCFGFRWGMIEKLDNLPEITFQCMLKTYKVFSNIHIKSMFKKKDFIRIQSCHTALVKNPVFYCDGYIGDVKILVPLNSQSYKDHVLIHIHTRSLDNCIFKAVSTVLNGKKINNLKGFANYINGPEANTPNLDKIKNLLGLKASRPYIHSQDSPIMELERFSIPYDHFISTPDTNRNLELVLNRLKIDKDKYSDFVSILSNSIVKSGTFMQLSPCTP